MALKRCDFDKKPIRALVSRTFSCANGRLKHDFAIIVNWETVQLSRARNKAQRQRIRSILKERYFLPDVDLNDLMRRM
jgi:hypothetical protein